MENRSTMKNARGDWWNKCTPGTLNHFRVMLSLSQYRAVYNLHQTLIIFLLRALPKYELNHAMWLVKRAVQILFYLDRLCVLAILLLAAFLVFFLFFHFSVHFIRVLIHCCQYFYIETPRAVHYNCLFVATKTKHFTLYIKCTHFLFLVAL